MATKGGKQGIGTALVIGRFQPFHNGHLEAISGILSRHELLILVIGSAQESRTLKNPFSSKERADMISKCLRAVGLDGKVSLVPLADENNHPRWVSRVLGIAKDADVVYSGNWLVQSLLGGKYEVHTMKSNVKISATQIREMMGKKDPKWKGFVPKEIREYIIDNGLLGTFEIAH